jgi:hypothetical protein
VGKPFTMTKHAIEFDRSPSRHSQLLCPYHQGNHQNSQMPNQHLLWGELQTDWSLSIFLQTFFLTPQPLSVGWHCSPNLHSPPPQYCRACVLSHGPLPFMALHLFWITQNNKCIQDFNLALLWAYIHVTSWHISPPWILIHCNFWLRIFP